MGAAEVQTDRGSVAVSGISMPDCLAEAIVLEGEIRWLIRGTTDASGTTHFVEQQTFLFQGTGVTSGRTYLFRGGTTAAGSITSERYVSIDEQRTRLVAEGGGVEAWITFRHHVRRTADGTFVVLVEVDVVRCSASI
jgi:hypothetical protein